MNGKSLAIITARGGSKRIPRKNIKEFLGQPIIYYSIKAALESEIFETVMVSTDDEEIAEISRNLGAEVPFMRSVATSNDYASTEEVVLEVIAEFLKRGETFDFTCCIYPTAPFLTGEKLKEAMVTLENSDADSLIPIVKFSYPPQRAFLVQNDKVTMKYPEFIKTPSQNLEEWYHDCGQFYCMRTEVFLRNREILTDNSVPYIISEMEVQDIDNEEDWSIAEIKYTLLKAK